MTRRMLLSAVIVMLAFGALQARRVSFDGYREE